MTAETISTASARPKLRAPRWMWLLLVLSLAGNLLVVGIIVGASVAVTRGGYWNAPNVLQRAQRFMNGLTREHRAEIRKIFAEFRPTVTPAWSDEREARKRIGLLIQRGGYTQEEMGTAIDDLYAAEQHARLATKPMIMAMLGKLEPQERLHFLRVFLPYLSELQGRSDAEARDGGVMGQGR